ncbi:MAG: nicotinate (nicotinamide) nucleotide adenylyltransferase [Clostridia bacterium]|nr:nicotinate (nicotinamide) nucleotide adenylyltransferase [Clostridia bacterium]
MKILIFGGAFNPVHKEHVNMFAAAYSAIGCGKAFVIPTAVSPHKSGQMQASPEQRLKMCSLAFGGFKNTVVRDYEIKNGGASYSYITCEHFKELYPQDELYFLMGADMFATFGSWKNPSRILACATLAVCAREGEEPVTKSLKNFNNNFSGSVKIINYTGAKVSSTAVRVKAALGYDISADVPQLVAQYAATNGVYLNKKLAEAQTFLKPKRAAHTLRVAVMAAKNCSRINCSELKAVTAAALHDAAKNLPTDSPLLKGFTPPQDVPDPVMHQYSGAYLAENYFGIKDPDIINAIRYHTSGRAGMSPLEKLIFLCDMLEEDRNFDGIDALRTAFYRSIDDCFYLSAEHQYKYLLSTGSPVYYLTEQAYEYELNRRKN